MTLRRMNWSFVLVTSVLLTGCETNQFQQEVQTEEAAVKLANETVAGGYELITTATLKKMLNDDDEFLLVDAMPTEKFETGHLSGAVNFTFPKEVMDDWNETTMGDKTQSDFQTLLGENRERAIVFYCGFVKCARSHNAAVYAQKLGYTNVLRYPGGIYAWRGAGHPLTTD
ncbi:MAG: rhodanese-like domain-containing protein [Planctomycetota bacterium]